MTFLAAIPPNFGIEWHRKHFYSLDMDCKSSMFQLIALEVKLQQQTASDSENRNGRGIEPLK